MTQPIEDYRSILNDYLNSKKKSNPKYSLRAFAKSLDVSHSRLSMVLNRQRGLSYEAAKVIAKKLKLDGDQEKIFELSAKAESSRSFQTRLDAEKQIEKIRSCNNFEALDQESFKIICEWQYFAILELINTKDFQHNMVWIANRLGLDVETVRESIQRLRDQGMLRIENNRFIATDESLTTTNEIPSVAIRNYHKSILKKASKAVDHQPVEHRDLAALTIGINKEKVPELKQLMKKFRRELNQLAEQTPNEERDSVYMLSSQLFELTES